MPREKVQRFAGQGEQPVCGFRVRLVRVALVCGFLAWRAALSQTLPPISLTHLNPGSTLLPPGTSSLSVSFATPQADTCGYSVNTLLDLSQMQPVDTAGPSATHQVVMTGLNPDPRAVNDVYVRCASAAGFWAVQYRVVAALGEDFPRIGSIWAGDFGAI